MNNPVHPDAILREDVLAAIGVSVSDAAKSVGVARVTLALGAGSCVGWDRQHFACEARSTPDQLLPRIGCPSQLRAHLLQSG